MVGYSNQTPCPPLPFHFPPDPHIMTIIEKRVSQSGKVRSPPPPFSLKSRAVTRSIRASVRATSSRCYFRLFSSSPRLDLAVRARAVITADLRAHRSIK